MSREPSAAPNADARTEDSPETGEPASVGVRAVSRALAILSAFAANPGPHSLSALARATVLDKGTTRRLLLTLMQSEFVALDARTQGYMLGPRILKLAGAVSSHRDLRDLVRPILVRLGEETRTTVHLSQEQDHEAVCIERHQPAKASVVFPHWNVGGRTMLNSGAAPWLLMAAMPDERIAEMLAQPDLRALLAPPVDPEEIRQKIQSVRKRDWLLSVNEVADGLTALAAPIRDARGRAVAAISLVGLTPEMLANGKPRYLAQALAAADEASKLLIGPSPSPET